MTELEKMQYAKTYIDKLANGISPVDNTPAASTDIINNISISRCLFYVSDILRRVIDHGGEIGKGKAGKEPFYISAEEISKYKISKRPVSISEIAKHINSLANSDNRAKLKYSDITAWLIKIGLLKEHTTDEGKTVKRPTDRGKDMGISVESRVGLSGNRYAVVVYDRGAQQFIIDNIEAVMDNIGKEKGSRKRSDKAGKQALSDNSEKLSASEQDQLLIDLYSKYVSVAVIASTLGETEENIRKRLKDIGLLKD